MVKPITTYVTQRCTVVERGGVRTPWTNPPWIRPCPVWVGAARCPVCFQDAPQGGTARVIVIVIVIFYLPIAQIIIHVKLHNYNREIGWTLEKTLSYLASAQV